MMRSIALSLVSFSLGFIACSLPPARTDGPEPTLPRSAASQTGIASWYGPGFHGRLTASGAVYNQHDLTAAHQTLPLGTKAMVTNLENGRSAEVTINDRGPFLKGRIIDLSYAAGKMLGMIGRGTIPVRVEVIDSGPHRISTIRKSLDYTLQAGSFVSLENARRLKEHLMRVHPQISQIAIVPIRANHATYYRVQLGTFPDRREAEDHARQLARLGFSTIIMEK
ncbi:MAG: septal ring lytic transglycosylase RlpA family protein [Deltaproteobacteria bacterium]|nr:septal ring lytic transglycosylase RlpA family protein [Deltaproteobacteria bacterium]